MKAILKSLAKIFIAAFLVFSTLSIDRICNTSSSLVDMEKSSENSFAAGTWGEDSLEFQAESILELEQKVVEEEKILGDIETFNEDDLEASLPSEII